MEWRLLKGLGENEMLLLMRMECCRGRSVDGIVRITQGMSCGS
jgi:hypothetical protein